MNEAMGSEQRRAVYCVLSSRSLLYAERAMESLVAHSLDDLSLTLITDSAVDQLALVDAMESLQIGARHAWRVVAKSDADDLATQRFAAYPNLAAFRSGHPCWRKLTDPLLFAPADTEMVILDPDLYFPNRFRFEPTPSVGLLLMYQPPSCLLPSAVVERAYAEGIALAHHVDIGVAQWRSGVDLEWMDWLIGRLGGSSLPIAMHVEAIVWAALAMQVGGGYLDSGHWHCWRNAHWKRVARRLGVSGRTVLRSEPFTRMKCFHGGGIAKWWVPEALRAGDMPEPATILGSNATLPFEELTRAAYRSSERVKFWARRLGYHRLVSP